MTTYKGIKGFTIQTIAGDPPAPILGQVWYNTTSNVLKGYVSAAAGWASAPSLNQGREEPGSARNATQSAAMIFGANYAGAGYDDQTEQYNGTSWSEVNDMLKGRSQPGGLGINTAAMAVGGNYPTDTNYDEIWDGTSWAETANTNTWRVAGQATGTTAAGIIAGGSGPSYGGINCETWNGTSWTEVNNLSRSLGTQQYGSTCGTTTAALYYAGGAAGNPGLNESWDGTCWTAGNLLSQGRYALAGFGNATAAMAVGGTSSPPLWALTEQYNGSTWTEVGDLGTARMSIQGCGTTSLGIIAGGSPDRVETELWDANPESVKTFTSS